MGGKLFLVPVTLGDSDIRKVIPEAAIEIIRSLSFFIVENERSARRYLIKLGVRIPIDQIEFMLLNKSTNPEELEGLLKPVDQGRNIGLMSEAGVPGVADPGAEIVLLAHQKGIRVIPLVGPSSIILAIMGSGLNGQNFAFNGYLPVKSKDRSKTVKILENKSIRENQSQIFMETPFRNRQMLESILLHCNKNTRLCIATDLTLPTESIKTRSVGDWQNKVPDIHKRPTIFILQG